MTALKSHAEAADEMKERIEKAIKTADAPFDNLPTVSLCMIVKDEEKWLGDVLASAIEHVTEIVIVDTGSKDKTKEVAAAFGKKVKIYDFKWINDFSAARNFSFSKATGDWILWLDADDSFMFAGERNLRQAISQFSPTMGGVLMPYLYAFDEADNCIAQHKKVRLCRNDGTFTWKGRIHEDLVPVGAVDIGSDDEFYVRHRADEERVKASSDRNVMIAEQEYMDKKNDPRVVFNLATTYLALRRFNDAIRKYLEYIPMSGWDEEIYVAWIRIGMCLGELGQIDEAMNMYLRAVKAKPQYADAYRGLAVCSIGKGKLADAEEYYRMVLVKETPNSAIVWNPFEYQVAPYYELAQVCLHQNRFDDALEAVEEYVARSNGKENGLKLRATILEVKKELDFRKAYGAVAEYLDVKGEVDGFLKLIDALPEQFRADPALAQIRNKHFVKKESSGRDIAIWCGQAWESWGPDSLKTGIGGSEEAVIRLSRELCAKGWNVTVYNNCGAQEILDVAHGPISLGNGGTIPEASVKYKPFWLWNPADKFDVFVSWRQPHVFDQKINAPIKLLDLHDVPNLMDYPTKRLNEITKIMVKTEFHRKLLPGIPADKFMVIGHGVDPTEFEKNVPRNRKRIVSTSSYDRGLEHLLRLWPRIIAEVPDAQLKICYGWNLFEIAHGKDAAKMAWAAEMKELMKQPGIEELGRLSHQKVADLMSSSGMFAYPCHFEEIFCIASAKAQMAGNIAVVATSANCMEEVVKIGVHVKGDITKKDTQEAFLGEVIKFLKDEKLQQEVGDKARQVAREEFSWTKIADQWIEVFTPKA